MRLDSFLANDQSVSRAQAKQWITNGHVSVAGVIVRKPSYQLSDERVSLDDSYVKKHQPIPDPEVIPLDLLFEDDFILVLNKQPGLITHPAEGSPRGTLVNALAHYGCALSSGEDTLRPGIVHRLDKDTEGLMVIAKTDNAHADLKKQFQDRTVEKRYRALIKGHLSQETVVMEQPLKRLPKKRKMHCCSPEDPEAKTAKTIFKTLTQTTTKSTVEATLITGRMHQIRVHLATLGHPVLGDPLYGATSKNYATGQVLQSYKLAFRHPKTRQQLCFELPPSKRFY